MNAAQTHQSGREILKIGCKVGQSVLCSFINNTERALGSQQCSEAMQSKWRGPCLKGGTKESATEPLQQCKVGKTVTYGINILSPRERALLSQHYIPKEAKWTRWGQMGQKEHNLFKWLDCEH